MNRMIMLAVLAASVAAAGCKKKAPEEGPMPTGSGQAMGSGGAMGSAMGSAGAGSGMAGSAGSAGSAADTKPLTADDISKHFEECWGYFNDAKWDDFTKCYASDAVDEMPGGPMPPVTGNTAIVDALKGYKEAMPDLKGEQALEIIDGHTVVGVTLMTGTMTGSMKTAMGEMPPTKNKVGLFTAQVVDVNDTGEATHEWDFMDLQTMMGQMKPNPKMPVRPVVDKLPMAKEVVVAKDDDAEKANKDVAGKVMDAFNKHDAKAFGDLLADDAVWSEQPDPKDTDKKQTLKMAAEFWKAFGDVKLSSDKQYAGGNYVAVVGTLTGTNNGDMPSMHLKKTGKSVTVPFLMIFQVDGGKVKHAWLFDQALAFASQLGLMPAQAPAAPSGKK